jgi:RNA polymerase primary sigma factor
VAPGYVSQEARKLENQRRKLSMELGRRANLQELADWMELPIQRIRRVRGKFLLRQKSFEDGVTWRTMSPDRRMRFDAVEDEENLDMIETYDPALKHHLADERAENPEKTLESERTRRAICVVLKTLSPNLETVIRMRFGLCDNEEGFTLDQIAEFFNLSRERIRQIESKALRHLRHPSRSAKLKPASESHLNFWDILPEKEKENEFTHWTGLLMHLSAHPKHIGATCNDCRKYIKFYKGKRNE